MQGSAAPCLRVGREEVRGLGVSLALYLRNVNHFENRYKKEAAHIEMYYVF